MMSLNDSNDFGRDLYLILQTLTRYSLAIDTKNPALLRRVFTPDAQIDVDNIGIYSCEEFIGMSEQGLKPFDVTQHTLGMPHLELDGDHGRSRCYCIAQHVRHDLAPQSLLLMGAWYNDEWRRQDGEWRIARRHSVMTWMDGNPEVVGLPGVADGQGGLMPSGAFPKGEGRSLPGWVTF